MSNTLSGAVKHAFGAATQNAKIADLQHDISDPTNKPASGYTHTTDHGVPISDTDNW